MTESRSLLPRVVLLAAILVAGAFAPAFAQVALPPPGGALHPFLAPPSGLAQDFIGTWNLSWDDPPNRDCPCRGTLTIWADSDGALKGQWPLPGGAAALKGEIALNNDAWAGTFSQGDDVDFPIKGHFRLEARDTGRALTGSYQRDGTTIPFRWSATRR
jgi:hypothetical protein